MPLQSPTASPAPPPLAPRAGAAIALAGALLIAALTLRPDPGAPPFDAGPYCLLCGEYGLQDFLLNVLLFVPLGLGLRLAGVRWPRVVLAAALTTLAVEGLQFTVIAGRDASLGDLVSNTTGGAVGALLVARWRSVLTPAPPTARRLARWGTGAWLALAVATAASCLVWSPGPEWLWRRSPWVRRWGWFPGRVLAVAANGAQVTPADGDGDGRFSRDAGVRVGGPLRMDALVVVGGTTLGRAAIATVVDGRARDVAALGQNGRDLTFGVRTAASLARTRVPGLTVGALFAPRDERAARGGRPVAGDTVWITGEYSRRALALTARWRGGAETMRAPLHPFVAWSYLLPWRYDYGRLASLLSAWWAGGLLLPVVYWAARGQRRAEPALAAAAAVVALVAVPAATGVGWAPVAVWGGVALGGAAGMLAGRRAAGAADGGRAVRLDAASPDEAA